MSAFNDVTEGGNHCVAYDGPLPETGAVCCQSGFFCTKGWDPVTGWGSIDYSEFSSIFAVATPYVVSSSGGDDDVSLDLLGVAEIVGIVVCFLAVAALVYAVVRYVVQPKVSIQQQGFTAGYGDSTHPILIQGLDGNNSTHSTVSVHNPVIMVQGTLAQAPGPAPPPVAAAPVSYGASGGTPATAFATVVDEPLLL